MGYQMEEYNVACGFKMFDMIFSNVCGNSFC